MAAIPHPNATVGGLGGGLGAEAVINISRVFGWNISAGWAVWVAAAATGVVLFIGKNGLAGAWGRIMHGNRSGGLQ